MLLLDSGAVRPIRAKSKTTALAVMSAHNAEHRYGMAERERCSAEGDYMNFPLVLPRLAVGLICPKRRGMK